MTKSETSSKMSAGILARFGQVLINLIIEAAILFLASGRLDWLWAWVYLGIFLVSTTAIGTLMLRTSPETVAERGKPKSIVGWDRWASGIWGLANFFGLPLAAGLDVRFGWTQALSAGWNLAGAVIFAAGLALFGWAMIENAYFSTVVRIQTDRGHKVCRSGPYAFVRHPGYVGAILQSIGFPLLLGSLWAFVPGIIAVVTMIVRTALEDRLLQAELPGYREFAQDVRFRLLPGVW